jgi:hypothetical protein
MTPPTDLVAPIYKPDSVDMRCGCNATLGWSKPKTATIRAGDTVGFGVGEPQLVCPPDYTNLLDNDVTDAYRGPVYLLFITQDLHQHGSRSHQQKT